MNLTLSPSQIGDDQILNKHKSSTDTFLSNDSVDTSGVSPGLPTITSSNKHLIYDINRMNRAK